MYVLCLNKQNAAIFWYNYKRSGSMDPLFLHAACPVVIGEKWGKFDWRQLSVMIVQWHDPTFSRNLAWSNNNHFYAFFNSF